jgi:hypothetical protein
MMRYIFIMVLAALSFLQAFGQEEYTAADTTAEMIRKKSPGPQPLNYHVLDPAGKYYIVEDSNYKETGLRGLMSKDHRILLKPKYYDIRMLGNCIVTFARAKSNHIEDKPTITVYDPSLKPIYKHRGWLEENSNSLKRELSDNLLKIGDTCVIIDDDGKHIKEFPKIEILPLSGVGPVFLVKYQTNDVDYSESYYYHYSMMKNAAFYSLSEKKLLTDFVYSNVAIMGTHLIKVFHVEKEVYQILDNKFNVLYEGPKILVEEYYDQGLLVAFGININDKEAFIIDSRGVRISKNNYFKIKIYSTGYRCEFVALQNNKYGIIDWKENILLPFQYDSIFVVEHKKMTQDGYPDPTIHQTVFLKKDNKYGVYDQKTYRGTQSILRETRYDTIYKLKDLEWSYTDDFIFKVNDKYGLVKDQVKKLDPEYDTIIRHPVQSVEGFPAYCYLFKRQGKWGYLDWNDQYISPQYDEILGNSSVFIFKKSGAYFLYSIRTKEEVKLENIFGINNLENSQDFTYMQDKKYGLLTVNQNWDIAGTVKGTQLFDSIVAAENYYGNKFFVLKNGKWGAVNPEEQKIIVPFDYDSPSPARFSNGYLVKKNNLYGIYDEYYEAEILPCQYDKIIQTDYAGEYHNGENTYMCYLNKDSLEIKLLNEHKGQIVKDNLVLDTIEKKSYSIISKGKEYYVIKENDLGESYFINYYYYYPKKEKQTDNQVTEGKVRYTTNDINNIYTETNERRLTVMGIKNKDGMIIVPATYQKIIYRNNYYLALNNSNPIYLGDENVVTISLIDAKGKLVRRYEVGNKNFIETIFKRNPKNLFRYPVDSLKNYVLKEDEYAEKINAVLKNIEVIKGRKSSYNIFNVDKNEFITTPLNDYNKIISDHFFYGKKDNWILIYDSNGKELLSGENISFRKINDALLIIFDQNKKAFTLDRFGTKTMLIENDLYLDFFNTEKNMLVRNNNKYGILDQNLKILLPVQYDTIVARSYVNADETTEDNGIPEAHYLIKKNNKWGLAIKDRIVLEPLFDTLLFIGNTYNYNNYAMYLVFKDKKQNILNTEDGKFVLDHFVEKVSRLNYSFSEPGCMDEMYYDYTKIIFRENGKVYIDNKLTTFQDFYNGKNNFNLNESQNYNEYRNEFDKNRIVLFLKKENKWGAVDLDNVVIVPIAYDTIIHIGFVNTSNSEDDGWNDYNYADGSGYSPLSNQYAIVKNENKVGLFLYGKHELIPCRIPIEVGNGYVIKEERGYEISKGVYMDEGTVDWELSQGIEYRKDLEESRIFYVEFNGVRVKLRGLDYY